MRQRLAGILIPCAAAVLGLVVLGLWIGGGPGVELQARVPGMDLVPLPGPAKKAVRPVPGQPVLGDGRASSLAGAGPASAARTTTPWVRKKSASPATGPPADPDASGPSPWAKALPPRP